MALPQAWRTWRSAKGVALLAAAALAAGIGSATAIYTVVNGVMLRPLPYRDGDRFVAIFGGATNDPEHFASLTYRDAQTYHDRTQAFDAFGWFRESGKNLTFAGEPHHVQGVAVTAPFVRHLGVEPVLGRWFASEDEVVLSSALWRRLGSDPRIVGRALTLDGRAYSVAGVMPDSFRLPVAGIRSAGRPTDVWLPLSREEVGAFYFAYARRRPGVSFEQAEADARRVGAELAAEDPIARASYTARVADLRETVVKPIRPTLLLLLGAAGLLFLITCANAAALLVARSVARARETAMRVALGADRRQLAAQYFAESLPVALGGAAGGLLLAATITPAIVAMAADYIPRAEDVRLDWRVVSFALGAAVLATALSGFAPLLQAVKTAPADVLGEGARASAGAHSRRLSQWLVVVEIALAFALLAASAALLLHLRTLSRTSAGFDTERLLTFALSVPGSIAAREDTRAPFQQRLLDAIQAIPGVQAAAFASQLPLDGCCLGADIHPEGFPVDTRESQRTSLMAASPGFMDTMRIPLRRGRFISDRDLSKDLIFAAVNEAAVRRYWRGEDPVGKYARFVSPDGARFQVVGVVGDVKNDGLGRPVVPEVYILSQIPAIETMHFVVRSERTPAALVPEIRQAVRAIDPDQPIHDVFTMREILQRSMTLERAASFLTSFFAAAALFMAMLGVYGVVSYLVRQRTIEIGTRMALGASGRDVVALILGGSLRTAALGVIAGAVAAMGAALYLDRVFGLEAFGAAPLVYSTAVIGVVALASSSVPAWRASLLSPMVAIRDESTSIWQVAGSTARQKIRAWTGDLAGPAARLDHLIPEFAGFVRQAGSVREATQTALDALRARAGAQSVALLEKVSDGEYGAAGSAIPARGFLLNRLEHYPRPLALTPADFEAWLRWSRDFRSDYTAEIEFLKSTGARLAVPLRTRDETVGVLLLGPPAGRDAYTPEEKETLRAAGDVLALMIENARLTERELEQEKTRRDLALAAAVQKRLLPPHAPTTRTMNLAGFSLAARTVGGDYYDFLDLGDGRIGVAVADVAGKGIAAALLMAVVQASLRVISVDPGLPVAELAARMNGFLYRSTGANKYATFFYAQVDERRRLLRYVNAGHNPPILVRRGRGPVALAELAAGGTVLGLFPDMAYEEAAVDLRPGDLLVAFTDGVTEALNAAGEEFGEERLKARLMSETRSGAAAIASDLTAAVRDWIGSAEQHDDLTVVVLSVGDSQ